MIMKGKIAVIGSIAVLLSGCLNMPTQSAQITGAYVSSLPYEQFDCPRLSAEYDSLTRRESQLVIAQDQRVKTSKVQAFWYGFGQGDGVEASELAQVRGEREAVQKALAVKNCIAYPAAANTPVAKPAASTGQVPATGQENCVSCANLVNSYRR
jgi:hypothetical protein